MSGSNARHHRCRVVGYCLYGSAKCPSIKRAYPPGSHGKGLRRKQSDYGKQLLEKQKLRDTYGMKESQFLRFFKDASGKKGVTTGDALLILLESRLDNLVYRLGFGKNIFDARQLVGHGHILVDGKRLNIPSCIVKANNKIALSEKAKKFTRVQDAVEFNRKVKVLPYVSLDDDRMSGSFSGINNVGDIPNKIEVSQVVELYSK
ncbi:MAG: 30S ribosomal protein S4 [bacterium]